MFKSPTPSGGIKPAPSAARSAEPLATQISSGHQAVRASQLLARQAAQGGAQQQGGRTPAASAPIAPIAPNGYAAPMQQAGQPYAMMQSPAQIQGEEYARQAYGGNGMAQAGAMYNNDPRYGQQQYGAGYGQQQYAGGAGYGQQQYMDGAGYGQEEWAEPPAPDQKRRALIIVGAAAAAAILGAGAFNLLRTMRTQNAPDTTQTNNNGAVATPGPKTGQATTAPTGKTTGTVIANQKNVAVNTALDFANPTNKHPSVLVHLPNGNFAAYDKACTHQGVAVAYKPETKTLVCPLHGSIFDPANNGAVLHGPAFVRLPPVVIHVNTDGSITV